MHKTKYETEKNLNKCEQNKGTMSIFSKIQVH